MPASGWAYVFGTIQKKILHAYSKGLDTGQFVNHCRSPDFRAVLCMMYSEYMGKTIDSLESS
jgi:hypothetical protein